MKKWQCSFFYVKSAEGHDALNLPEFSLPPPIAELNFKCVPTETDEFWIIDNIVEALIQCNFDNDDLLRAFVARRVSPLQMREHKIYHMGDHLDPMRTSRHELSLVAVKRRVKAIASSEMGDEWNWHTKPFYRERPSPQVCSSAPNLAVHHLTFLI